MVACFAGFLIVIAVVDFDDHAVDITIEVRAFLAKCLAILKNTGRVGAGCEGAEVNRQAKIGKPLSGLIGRLVPEC